MDTIGPAGDLVGDLTRWLAEARVDAAAASRARTAWLRRQLDDEATVAGVLLDLAERGTSVAVTVLGGRVHHGAVQAVAQDFCALRDDRADSLVAYASIVAIRPRGTAAPLGGSRPAALDMSLVEALSALVLDGGRALVSHPDGTATAGELRSIGHDVAVLRPDGEGPVVYLPTATIAAVTLSRS